MLVFRVSMPIFALDIADLAKRPDSRFVCLLLAGLPKDSEQVLAGAYPHLDELTAEQGAALVVGSDAEKLSRVCLAHHRFDPDDWKVGSPCIMVSFQHPKDFLPEFEPADSPHAGYPASAVVFSLEGASKIDTNLVQVLVPYTAFG